MTGWKWPRPEGWRAHAEQALAEDLGSGDLTAACFAESDRVQAEIEAQAPGVLCGVGIAAFLLQADPGVRGEVLASDGDTVAAGQAVWRGTGPAAFLLSRERTALNYLMMLSGVATFTRRFVEAVAGTGARIADTRKTAPGLRALQKYAVRCGGGVNHRFGLFDAAMIKDNHIAACGSVAGAVARLRENLPHTATIEVECASLEEVDDAVAAGADAVLLDNMSPEQIREIVARYRGRAILEASGGVTLETVRAIAETGVDIISVGALTHSAPALPLHMEVRTSGEHR